MNRIILQSKGATCQGAFYQDGMTEKPDFEAEFTTQSRHIAFQVCRAHVQEECSSCVWQMIWK